jgi:hypothetical protein
MSIRKWVREFVNLNWRNPSGTVFIGRPEITDLVRKCCSSRSALSRIVNPIVREHRMKKIKAIDGVLGYEIPKEWFW